MNLSVRCQHFLEKRWPAKLSSAEFRFRSLWFRLLPSISLPIRLPYGGWWLASDDALSNSISTDNFERSEWRFVDRLLKKGMTVIDIGAHHGFYTILSSRKVGPSGRVIAFEPSPREEQRLALHLRLNRCKNVKVERFALAGENGEAEFFVVEGRDTVFNSLRPPTVSSPTKKIIVKTLTLNNYLKINNIFRIDFMKIDAEGAELEILKGSNGLFNQNASPVIMAEVSDMRTAQWGYQASKIFDHLSEEGYRWFIITSEGKLEPFRKTEVVYNFVAVPGGKLAEMKDLIQI
jgi:FkbM family methyltransferase